MFFSGECNWIISKPNSGSFLNLVNAVLNSNDTLTIKGIKTKDKKETFQIIPFANDVTTLYYAKGNFPQNLLVSLAGYDFITVDLHIQFKKKSLYRNDEKNSDQRSFYAVYYNSAIELRQNTGLLTFYPRINPKPISKGRIVFQPSAGLNDEKLVMLNFTQFPNGNSSFKVTVDGVQLNSLKTVFLQSPSSPNITVTVDMPQAEPITVHYLLVNRQCSESAVLKVGDQARPILYLNETERLNLFSSPVHCVMLYKTDVGNRLGVHLPSSVGIADSADSLYFYNKKGQVVLKRNNLEGVISTNKNMKINYLGETDTVVIIYESPYVIAPNADFQAPQIMAIPAHG